VSRDLVEDAFLNYLRKLDELARLDIVAMHLEQRDGPEQNVLHVFGRTYAEPHKYFYRRFAAGMWTPWEPVTAEIQGDHLAPVVWRDRLYLFWVTFMEKVKPSKNQVVIDYKTPQTVEAAPLTYLEAQLHWSEYLKGEWSTRESSGFDASSAVVLPDTKLDKINDVFVYVTKAHNPNGEESGVYVPLVTSEPPKTRAFYLAGRNSRPIQDDDVQPASHNPYSSASTARANRYEGKGPLMVEFVVNLTTQTGTPPEPIPLPQTILGREGNYAYTLLPVNNRLELALPESALPETESLIKPVFFQDDTHTFFVEPSVVERTVVETQTWLPPVQPSLHDEEPEWVREEDIFPFDPRDPFVHWVPDEPGEPSSPDDRLHDLRNGDWLVNPVTVMRFDDQVIGALGGVPLTFEQRQPGTSPGGTPLHVNPASAVDAAEVVVLGGGLTLEQVGLAQAAGGLNVVGASGVNAGMIQNVDQFGINGFGAGGAGATGR
jgi:hypothetical protein